MTRSALALLALVLLAGCASPAGPAQVTGTVTYRERIALPTGAVVRVTLLDVSLIDMPPRVIAQQELRPSQQVPIPFVLTFEPREIERGHRYGLRASIEDARGQPLWVSPAAEPVLTEGAPAAVELQVQRVAAAAVPTTARVFAYDCAGFSFRVEVARERAILFQPGRNLTLARVPAASGAKYSDGSATFWSKGGEASLALDGVEHVGCRARARLVP